MKLTSFSFLLAGLVGLSSIFSVRGDVRTYPEYPAGIERDYAYAVRVCQGETKKSLVVYNHCEKSILRGRTRGGDVNRRFCEFAFADGPVRVDIGVAEDVKVYKVFPARLGLKHTFKDGVISVTLEKPAYFGIQLNDSDKSILSVFADAPETDAPQKGKPGVMYVEGWVDAPGRDGVLTTGPETKEIYLAPGSVLNARLRVKGAGTRLHGRGMVLDPMSDIFRYDQTQNTRRGLVSMEASETVVDGVKLVDARTFNFMGHMTNQTWRNVKVLSSMMCSDGLTLSACGHLVEHVWLYVGDNALVIAGLSDSAFRDVAVGTSCAAVFPQGSNQGIRLENLDVFRADDGVVNNFYNGVLRRNNKWSETGSGLQRKEPGPQDLVHHSLDIIFRGLSAVDCTLFSHFFSGRNMGTRPKTFVFDGCSIPFSTGRSDWHAIGQTNGCAISVLNDPKKWLVTDNYSLVFTNLLIGGVARQFAADAVRGGDALTVSYGRREESGPGLPKGADRREVGWTCPYKVTRGGRLVRDWRLVDRKVGAKTVPVGARDANLVAEDGTRSRSVWQRVPSFSVKLEATGREDGRIVYRLVQCERGAGMQANVTEEFLSRGNGTWRVAFDMRSKSETPFQLYLQLVSNEKRPARGLTPVAPTQDWRRYVLDIKTDFDLAATDLVALSITATQPVNELCFRNLSLTKVSEDTRAARSIPAQPPLDGAKWIADPGSRNPAFAKAFSPRGKAVAATLAVTGVGWYEAQLNGKKVGDKVLDPIPTQYDKRVLYSTYDVSEMIREGTNELKILLGNGLYNVQEKCEWGFDRAPWKADPAAIAVLTLRYADGNVERIASDGSWRVASSPVLFSGFREGEVVLAEPKMDGAPRAATVVAGPKGRLELEAAPASKIVRDVQVEKVETLAEGSTVYRMAENMAGWARIRFTGLKKGDVVTIRYDERHPREASRHIDRFCRSLPSTNACPELASETAGFQTDRFVSAGGAEEFYEPRFSYNGFRYVTVKGATPSAADVIGRFVRTAFPKTGSFECDDAGFMKVMDATARAYESNFTDGFPTDCPHREKNGWLGDAVLAIPYAALEWGSAANTLAYRNWIRTIADGQSNDGRISSIAPHSGLFHFDSHACAGGPVWGAALTTIPTTLYRYRRDRAILAEAYPAMMKYVTKLLTERTAEGIVNYGLGDWCAVSWEWSKDRNFRTSLGLTSTAYAYRSLRETAAAAKLLGYAADAERFGTEAENLRRAFNAKYSRGNGIYDKNGSPTAQAVALEFGLAEENEIPAVRTRLVEAVHEMDDKIDFGIVGSRTVFRQLCEAGEADLAWKLIMRPDYPSYLNMVSQDVNTLMETFSGNCSHNHIMFGDVGAWAYEYLAGIQVGKGNARTGLAVTVRPFVPKTLNHVKASVELVEGRMTVEWTKKDGVFTLLLDIPNGVSATIVMPDGKVRTALASHQEWKCFLES